MQFLGHVTVVTDTTKPLNLDAVWDFKPFELSPIADQSLKAFKDKDGPYFEIASQVAALSQAILEFQDLIMMILPKRRRLGSSSYLFFEGLSTLREATLIGASGLTHSSLAAFRSAVEMLVLHEWWRERLLFSDSHEEFYEWLEGQTKSVPFKNALESNYQKFARSPYLTSLSEARATYELLCRYAHRPILGQSTTPLRGGNIGATPTPALITFWLDCAKRTLNFILDHMISARPECLFETDIYRKFGFNKPAGAFFDRYNLLPVQMALGAEKTLKLRDQLKNHDTVVSLTDWAVGQPDLTDEQIMESWTEPPPKNDGETISEKIFLRIIHQKAQSRAIAWSFAYNLGIKEILI